MNFEPETQAISTYLGHFRLQAIHGPLLSIGSTEIEEWQQGKTLSGEMISRRR